jgi:L-fuconate dehydratase
MPSTTIHKISTHDARYKLPRGAGSDAVHTDPEYCMAVTLLESDHGLFGTGIALTLGNGNRLVCEAIEMLARPLVGLDIEDVMADFGNKARQLADDPSLRWLGPHKGVVHLALASITNACFDPWAKSRGVPLWKLLLDLKPEEVVRLLDLSYVEDEMSTHDALALLRAQLATRPEREHIIADGYPGYDTSVGWMAYGDDKVRELTMRSIDRGFTAFKLKVGSADVERDYRRAAMLRECVGDAGL